MAQLLFPWADLNIKCNEAGLRAGAALSGVTRSCGAGSTSQPERLAAPCPGTRWCRSAAAAEGRCLSHTPQEDVEQPGWWLLSAPQEPRGFTTAANFSNFPLEIVSVNILISFGLSRRSGGSAS